MSFKRSGRFFPQSLCPYGQPSLYEGGAIFDNEIDWVNTYKAEQLSLVVVRKLISEVSLGYKDAVLLDGTAHRRIIRR